jgi:hypothetical protein
MDPTAISEADPDLRALRLDADRAAPLLRVNFAEGMLLGIEATNAEQEFHRRRLVRHQHWLHGAGTVVGLAVSLRTRTVNPPDAPALQQQVEILVAPGVAVDGLGREVQVAEPYCINLIDWLVAQGSDAAAGAFDAAGRFTLAGWLVAKAPALAEAVTGGVLNLRVSVRQEADPQGLQPAFASALNDSTDAVTASRIADGLALELTPDLAPGEDHGGRPAPWAGVSVPADAQLDAQLDTAESARLAALPDPAARSALRRRARLLFATGAGLPSGAGSGVQPDALAEPARILLARIAIAVPDPASLVVDPATLHVDNLVRPFAVADALLPA